jgi:adenylate kinase
MHLIIYGPEGSGKGTQGKMVAEKFGLPIYTSGDLVRDAAEHDKGLIGEACRKALSEGRYVPDSEMYVLWKNKLKSEEAIKGFLLDGFPRNIRQAKFLTRKISKYGYDIDTMIYLTLTDEEATKRLVKRNRKLFEGSTESHDSPERVQHRLQIYREQEAELLKFFKEQNKVLEVNANQPAEQVFADIVKGLGVA